MSPRWTSEQAAAIVSDEHTLLSASAGTGKTTTIVGKILWSLGLDPGPTRHGESLPSCPDPIRLDQVAAITFTEKAAHDLAAKLRTSIAAAPGGEALRRDLGRAAVGTIHGFAAELLREHALRMDIDPAFRILDPRETEIRLGEIVGEVLADALRARDPGAVALTRRYGLRGWRMAPGAIGRVLGVIRDLRWRAEQFDEWSREVEDPLYTRELDLEALEQRARFVGAWAEGGEARRRDEASLQLADALYRLGRTSVGRWLSWLERENARDFDSLILDVRRLLTRPENRPARDAVRRRFRLLVIDEFQDTDAAQWEIASAISGLPDGDDPGAGSPDGRPGPEGPQAEGPTGPEAPRPGESVERDAGPRLFLVGDPKQSIYRFRGADVRVWSRARAVLREDGHALALTRNFRSEPIVVHFVNRVGERALGDVARPLRRSSPGAVVEYDALRPGRPSSPAAGIEWIAMDATGSADEVREEEARRVAARLHEILGRGMVVDPDEGDERRARPRDVAILARRNADLRPFESALRSYDLPFYNSATSGLADQQEVLDLVSALRLLDNRHDDLRAFAFLRSPFVGLRDEIGARIALLPVPGAPDASLLDRARAFLDAVEGGRIDWYGAPESPHIADIERAALAEGLDALDDAHAVVDRSDHAEMLERLLARTGYRQHLLLREGAAEARANIERFLALLEEYRHLSLGRFLRLWERWGEEDLGIPQARLFSSEDDVIHLSTIHAAKGLEWPIVVLAGLDTPLPRAGTFVGSHWTDPAVGPVLLPREADRGPRDAWALERQLEHERAEEARLLYVAATRARDRLILSASLEPGAPCYASWLVPELEHAMDGGGLNGAEAPLDGRRGPANARDDDDATRTGSQLEAFDEEAAGRRQLDLFAPAEPDRGGDRYRVSLIRSRGGALQTAFRAPPVSLAWLEGIERGAWPDRAAAIEPPEPRLVSSATERMARARDERSWRLRYVHGVLEPEAFLPDRAGEGPDPRTRGTLIHGVLERLESAAELSAILDETIASLDLGEMESPLRRGTTYREALEREIAAVVESPEWSWYTGGSHHRELRFLHRSSRGWVQGAFDLFRPGGPVPGAAQGSLFDPADPAAGAAPWIIDFKTHRIGADRVEEVAGTYAIQVEVYRAAVAALVPEGEPPRVALHFTYPNLAVER